MGTKCKSCTCNFYTINSKRIIYRNTYTYRSKWL